jgi:hypothetical protein
MSLIHSVVGARGPAYLCKGREAEKIGRRVTSRQPRLLLIPHENGVDVFFAAQTFDLVFGWAVSDKDHLWHLRPRWQVGRKQCQRLDKQQKVLFPRSASLSEVVSWRVDVNSFSVYEHLHPAHEQCNEPLRFQSDWNVVVRIDRD